MRYRSLTNRYLASDGVYHLIKIFFKLHSQATWLVHKGSTGLRPRCLAIPSFIRFAYGSITLYSSFFQTKKTWVFWKFRKVINWYYAHGLSFTLHLCAAFPPGANSRLGLGPSFSFAITQEIIVIFFSLHLLRCFNSVGCSYLNWNINAIKKCSFLLIF